MRRFDKRGFLLLISAIAVGIVQAQEIRLTSTNLLFGRRMLGSTVTDMSIFAINFASGDRSFGLTGVSGLDVVPTSSTTLSQYGMYNLSVGLNNSASGSGTVGLKSWQVAVTGNVDAGFGTINVSSTIVSNRVLTANNDVAVDFGKVMVNYSTFTSNIAIRTTGGDDSNTRLTLGASSMTYNGADWLATLQAGSAAVFSNAASTATRGLAATFSSAGIKNETAYYTPGGEGLSGESVNAMGVQIAAAVYRPAVLSVNNSGVKGVGPTLAISNAPALPGELRSLANVHSMQLIGGNSWTISGVGVGTNIASGVNLIGTVAFDSSDKLNGTHQAQLTLGFQNDQTIRGASSGDLGSSTWSLQATVAGRFAASGSVDAIEGQSLAGYSLTLSNNAMDQASILDGTADGNLTLSLRFGEDPQLEYGRAVTVDGSGSSLYVLSLRYDPSLVPGGQESSLILGWYNGGTYVNAVDGNVGGTPQFVSGAYQSGYGLGTYGVDELNNDVWAVVNHGGTFGVIPEPLTISLMLTGLLALRFRRRK